MEIKKTLGTPAGRAWHLITDTRTWPRWGPSVRAVECRDRFIRAGTTGRIRAPVNIWLPFVIEDLEPEYYWDWRVGGIAATGHRVEPRGDYRCKLSFSIPVWAFGYGIVCDLALCLIERLLVQSKPAL